MSGSLFNSFDDEELDNGAEAEQDSVEELFEEAEELDEEMVEAEKRISLAGYYQRLARGGIFKDGSDEARIVDAEVRLFARERMSVLLGLPSAPKPQVELPFSDEQLDALRQWADRIIEKQRNAGQPQMVSPKPPQLPPAAAPQRPSQPVITPVQAPPQMQQLAKPSRGAMDMQARKKPAQRPAPQPRKRQQKVKSDYSNIPDLQPFEVDGTTYKWVTNPDNGERVMLKVNTQRQVGQDGTAQHHPGRIPNLSPQALAAISADKAVEALETTPAAKSQTIQTAAALSIIKQD